MLAERFIVRTDRDGRLTGLPVLPPNEEIEVILLPSSVQSCLSASERLAISAVSHYE